MKQIYSVIKQSPGMLKITLALILLITLSYSCKKEKGYPPVFSPTGSWDGYMYLYHIVLVNRDDGTSRLYMGIVNGDTATAGAKLEGIYSVNDDAYRARYINGVDTVILETIRTTSSTMNGFVTRFTEGTAFPFEVVRKP